MANPVPTAALQPSRDPAASVIAQALTLAVRSVRMSMRRPDALLTALLMPILLMLLFGGLFGGAIHTGTDYVTYLLPGVLLTTVLLGASTTAVSVSADISGGMIDRLRSLDVGGPAFLAGQVAASVLRSAASSALVFAAAVPMGLHAEATPWGWLAIAALALLLIVTVSWLSALAGLLVSSPDAASSLTFFTLVVSFISSAFVPTDTMPDWLRPIAQNQPASLVIDSMRALLQGDPPGSGMWTGIAWCLAIIVTCVALSRILFQRRTERS